MLNGNGIKTYLFDRIAPVSVLSYGITRLKCSMGVMITASHNPKIYNGYKVYNRDGYQIVGDEPHKILEEIQKVDFFSGIKYDRNNIEKVPEDVPRDFVDIVSGVSTNLTKSKLNELKKIGRAHV